MVTRHEFRETVEHVPSGLVVTAMCECGWVGRGHFSHVQAWREHRAHRLAEWAAVEQVA